MGHWQSKDARSHHICLRLQVAANSLVLKAVPPKTMVAGSPARVVGKVTGALFTIVPGLLPVMRFEGQHSLY